MRIELVIENIDTLANGGPTRIAIVDRSFEIGREPPRDWVLPDPDRFISSRHCEVRFEAGGFVLVDHSTNGTFLNGSDRRLTGPQRLASGDRIQIGRYVVAVAIGGAAVSDPVIGDPAIGGRADGWGEERPEPSGARQDAGWGEASDDPWSIDGPFAPPIELTPPPRPLPPSFEADVVLSFGSRGGPGGGSGGGSGGGAASGGFRPAGAVTPPDDSGWAGGVRGPRGADGWGDGGEETGDPDAASPGREDDDVFEIGAAARRASQEAIGDEQRRPATLPAGARMADAAAPMAFVPARPAPRPVEASFMPGRSTHGPSTHGPSTPAPSMADPAPSGPTTGPAADTAGAERLLADIAVAAGLDPRVLTGRPADEVAREIGALLALVTGGVGELLRMRAKAKTLTRSADRTTIEAAGNNALKFSPNAQGALAKMFGAEGPGYLAAGESFEEAFRDLSRHELITFAAMQKALKRLIDDLSPDSITARLPSSVMPFSKKAQAWDLFVTRWDAKTEPFEHGMLDVFLQYFREIYDETARSKRG